MGESFNKGLVEIEESYCPSYFRYILGRGPFVNSGDFYGVHAVTNLGHVLSFSTSFHSIPLCAAFPMTHTTYDC